MNQQMIVFGEDWGRHPSSTQHLIRQLMGCYDVIWINSIGLRTPRLRIKDFKRIGQRLQDMWKPDRAAVDQQQPTPQVVTPGVLPMPGSGLMREVNSRLLQRTLSPLLQSGESGRPLLWTSLPSAVDMVGKLGEAATIYYCGDDFSQLEGVEHEPVMAMEAELAEKADLILTASEALQARFPAHKTHLLNHGVDFPLFARPAPPAPELAVKRGPVVGFFGSISSWFDQARVAAAAQALPGWRFVLIGKVETDITLLQQQPNIELLGPRPHHLLPSYVQHWDVSILPFVSNGQIEACNPLKLREYMAAGTAIVSSRFPAISPYSDLIRQVDTDTSFIGALKCARQEGDRYRQRRQDRVMNESWDARARQLQQLLEAL